MEAQGIDLVLLTGESAIAYFASSSSSKLHFLWVPEAPAGPQLEVDTKETHHVPGRLRATPRHSIIASTSASDELTAVGWLFAINFKLEQVMAVSVRSNVGGMKGQAVRLACNFRSAAPQLDGGARKDPEGPG